PPGARRLYFPVSPVPALAIGQSRQALGTPILLLTNFTQAGVFDG
ncbi:unnamed protein product, partial [marine sediment metagenome]